MPWSSVTSFSDYMWLDLVHNFWNFAHSEPVPCSSSVINRFQIYKNLLKFIFKKLKIIFIFDFFVMPKSIPSAISCGFLLSFIHRRITLYSQLFRIWLYLTSFDLQMASNAWDGPGQGESEWVEHSQNGRNGKYFELKNKIKDHNYSKTSKSLHPP